MKAGCAAAILALFCGCSTTTPIEPPKPRPVVRRPVSQSEVTCTYDLIRIPRSQHHKLEQLWPFTESGGIHFTDEKAMPLNGLRVGRMDMRFQEQFVKAVESIRTAPRPNTYVRFLEGQSQVFDLGETFRDETVFIWSRPDSVIGRHFERGRFRMRLSVDRVSNKSAEFEVSWELHTGPLMNRTVSIPSLEVQAVLEEGQSLVVAPADFSGRGVGRAFLHGREQSAVDLAFIIITPTRVLTKTEPAAGAGSR
jgi:hypothetical protein